jgi:hypothetical protein
MISQSFLVMNYIVAHMYTLHILSGYSLQQLTNMSILASSLD